MGSIEDYEGLIKCTARKFRNSISSDIGYEDICQELRIKAWKALESFDPSYGSPESMHVFVAVNNRVKDLMRRKSKPERPFSDLPSDGHRWVNADEAIHSSIRAQFTNPEDASISAENPVKTEILRGLTPVQQSIAICIAAGYTTAEIRKSHGISQSNYFIHVREIKAHVKDSL